MRNLAIIPARGGSQRIPKKNIKTFFGKPIIAYSIECALKFELFDTVMVSTDDLETKKIAIRYGAQVPFFRKKETADNTSTLADVVVEVLEEYKSRGIDFDYVCCILATAPFVTTKDLKKSFDKLRMNKVDAILPVVRYSFPIQRAMQFYGDKIKMIWPENMTKRSQDLTPSFHDAGLFYWIKASVVLSEKKLWTNITTAIEVSAEVAQDIDTIEDWKAAELKYKILSEK